MTNSVSSNRSKKYNIAAFFSGVGGIELGFEQTNEFRVVYANENAKNLLDPFLRDFFFLPSQPAFFFGGFGRFGSVAGA